MAARVFVGTTAGLWTIDGDTCRPVDALAGHAVTALALNGPRTWALVDGAALWEGRAGAWTVRASLDGLPATCVAVTPHGLLIGTEQAHLLELTGSEPTRVESFDTVDGRAAWYQPWGDPADVRSIAVARDAAILVNVHVGGIVRSRDRGKSWTPTVDIEVDVHQVLAHPEHAAVVLFASAQGLGVSRDSGASWQLATAGLHACYLRAVAVAGEHVLVSASTGFQGRHAAIYRRRLDGEARFERCATGLPKWFDDNVDTGCLAAVGSLVVFGSADGRVYRSLDAGERWELIAKGLPSVSAVVAG